MLRRFGLFLLPLGALPLLVSGCGQREAAWDEYAGGLSAPVYSLRSSIAITDVGAQRMIFANADSADTLTFSEVPIGKTPVASLPTSDKERMVVLSLGEIPRKKADQEGPSLQVIDSTKDPKEVTRYELSDPLSALALDPQGDFAVVYPGGDEGSFVQNPNELVLVELTKPPSDVNPLPASLRSFGGRPETFTFTNEMELPGGNRRLLVVTTDRDVALLDLAAPEKPEITVKLTTGAQAPRPIGVAVSDGAPGDDKDARVAVRLQNNPNVILLDLLPTPSDKVATSPHSFLPVPNIVDVGGVPSDVTFGNTDGGLRLLALVPSKNALVLVEPATGVSSEVALGAPFERMSIVSDIIGQGEDGSDVALLWSTQSSQIAFVALGSTVGKPYKSVERLSLESPVSAVVDVPSPNQNLKVLTSGPGVVVLDLVSRTASPLYASVSNTHVTVSPDGQRFWMSSPQSTSLAMVNAKNLHPLNLLLNYPITDAVDIERRNGGRAVLAVTNIGTMAITLLDAGNPSVENATEYLGVLLGDYQ